MATRRNPYRDPAIREGLNNIAGLFAPPSGQEMAGFATANARRLEADRLSWLFENATDPTASARAAVIGTQAYGNTPSGFMQSDATTRRRDDITAATLRGNNIRDNQRQIDQSLLTPVPEGQVAPAMPSIADAYGRPEAGMRREGNMRLAQGQTMVRQDGTRVDGAPLPLTFDQARADTFRQMTPEQQRAITFGSTPVDTVMVNGQPRNVTRPNAIGQEPAVTNNPDKGDNYLAIGPDGREIRFLGRMAPNGQVIDVNTNQPVPNVVRREGTSGGMSVEVGRDGTFRLVTGNGTGQTNSRVTDLQRAESEGNRAVNELLPLLGNLRQDDLGVSGNINDLLTNYGGQISPSLARPDVTGRRNQLRATTLSLAKALLGDDRLSDADRRAAEAVSVSNGIDESLPGAQAKIASLVVLNAYRSAFARSVRDGQTLPPLSPEIVGRLVDQGRIPPNVAAMYMQNNFNAPSQTSGPIPGVQLPQGVPGAPQAAPAAAAPPAASTSSPLNEARAAIQRGAPREAVIQRLQSMGIDPGGL